jgi:phospholipase/carboxylesterase
VIDLKYELVGASRLGNQQDVPVVITLHGMGSNYLDLRPSISFFNQKVIELHFQGSIEYANGYAYYIPRFFGSPSNYIGGTMKSSEWGLLYFTIKRILA